VPSLSPCPDVALWFWWLFPSILSQVLGKFTDRW
jgi:hypothetical protein